MQQWVHPQVLDKKVQYINFLVMHVTADAIMRVTYLHYLATEATYANSTLTEPQLLNIGIYAQDYV